MYVTIIHHIEWKKFSIFYLWLGISLQKLHFVALSKYVVFDFLQIKQFTHAPILPKEEPLLFFLLLPHVYRTAAKYGCFWQLKGNTLTATLFGLPHKYSLSKYENHTTYIPIQSMYQRNLKKCLKSYRYIMKTMCGNYHRTIKLQSIQFMLMCH